MVVVVNDTLVDANGDSLVTHTGPDGTTWTQHPVHSGVMQFQNNRVYCSTLGLVYASGVPGGAEYDVECEYEVLSDVSSMGIAGRISTSADTFYYCYYLAGEVVLAKRITSTITSLDVYVGTVSVGTHTLKLQIRDATKKVFVDGVERCSSVDNTITAAGRAGIRSGSANTTTTGKHIRDFLVTDLTSPPTVQGVFSSYVL